MSIKEVLTEIRLYIGRYPQPYERWADVIRAEIEEKARLNEQLDLFAREARTNHNNWAAAVREKDAEIAAHLYAHVEMMRKRDAKIERLKGMKPAPLDTPIPAGTIPRYMVRWNGPTEPLAVPSDDGYWTPWHVAHAEIERLQRACVGAIRHLGLVKDPSAHQAEVLLRAALAEVKDA